MFNPDSDLTAIQTILKTDAVILTLMDLSGTALTTKVNAYIVKKPGTASEVAASVIIAQSIIKRSTWSDLIGNDKRLCAYFRPSRPQRNLKFNEEVVEIDCHVPATLDFIAYQVQERIFTLLHEKMVNRRYMYFDGQLGELPTMSGFFCVGSKYIFKRKI